MTCCPVTGEQERTADPANAKSLLNRSSKGSKWDISDRVFESQVQHLCLTARIKAVQVVLRKLGRGSRAVSGRLVRAPRKGSVVVIEFSDGMHEYVTTPVRRVLRLASKDVFYIETVNSRYRLEVRDREHMLEDASSG